MVAVVAAVVVGAGALLVIATSGGSSPTSVVKSAYKAVRDGDCEREMSYLVEELQDDTFCDDEDDIDSDFDSRPDRAEFELVEAVTIFDAHGLAAVAACESEGDDVNTFTVDLIKEGGSWKIYYTVAIVEGLYDELSDDEQDELDDARDDGYDEMSFSDEGCDDAWSS